MKYKKLTYFEGLPGGSQVACRNFKMSRVGVLSRVHVAVGDWETYIFFFVGIF